MPPQKTDPLAQGTLKKVENIALPNTNGAMLRKPLTAPSVTNQQPMTLAQAIAHAKSNPTSDFAGTLGGFIQRGDADQQAMQEGVDLSFAGRPSLQDMYSAHLNKNGVVMPGDTSIEKLKNGYMDLINKAADNTVKQQQEGAKKIESSVTDAADKIVGVNARSDGEKGSKGLETAAHMGEAGLGAASGAVQAVFAPITGIIQAISDKASDTTAMQEFAEKGTGPILDLYNQLEKKIDEVSKSHPEAATNIGDAANVLLAVLGGKTEVGKVDVGEAGAATSKAALETAQGAKEGVQSAIESAGQAAGDITKSVGNTTAVMGEKSMAVPRAMVKGVKDQAGGAAKSAYSQIYGLPPEDIDFLLKHPEYATPEALSHASIANLGTEVEAKIGEGSRDVPKVADIAEEVKGGLQRKMQAVNEHAQEYTKLANQNKAIKVDPNWLATKLKDKKIAGVGIDAKGNITHGDADSAIRASSSPEGARAMQDLWDTWGPVFQDGKMTYKQFLSFRQDLAQIADYKGGVDTTLEKAAHAIRDKFNTEYRKNIPGMDKLDAEHTRLERDLEASLPGIGTIDKTAGLPKIKLNEGAASNMLNAGKETRGELASRLENITPGITKKIAQRNEFADKYSDIVDENGKLRENALANIKNSLNFAKDLKLKKLEELMPGIADRIRLIKAAENFHGTLGLKPGKYASGAAVSQILTGNPFVGIAAMAATNPSVGLRILRAIAKAKGQ